MENSVEVLRASTVLVELQKQKGVPRVTTKDLMKSMNTTVYQSLPFPGIVEKVEAPKHYNQTSSKDEMKPFLDYTFTTQYQVYPNISRFLHNLRIFNILWIIQEIFC